MILPVQDVPGYGARDRAYSVSTNKLSKLLALIAQMKSEVEGLAPSAEHEETVQVPGQSDRGWRASEVTEVVRRVRHLSGAFALLSLTAREPGA